MQLSLWMERIGVRRRGSEDEVMEVNHDYRQFHSLCSIGCHHHRWSCYSQEVSLSCLLFCLQELIFYHLHPLCCHLLSIRGVRSSSSSEKGFSSSSGPSAPSAPSAQPSFPSYANDKRPHSETHF